MRRSAATAQVEYLQRRSPALHKAVLSSLFFKQPSRVKPLLTFGSGAGSMSHCADWLPLAANAGLSWVSAAVWGGVSECLKETEKIENRFLSSFGLFAWVFFFFGGALQHQIQSVGGEDTDSRWFVGTWSMVFCVFEFALQAQQRFIYVDILCFQLCPCCLRFVCRGVAAALLGGCSHLQRVHSEMQICLFCAFGFLAFMFYHIK